MAEWRLTRTYDFTGRTDVELCFEVAERNVIDGAAAQAWVSVPDQLPDLVFCADGDQGPGDELELQCVPLPQAAGRGGVEVVFRLQSENPGEVMVLDNISVTTWPEASAFRDDFDGCTDPMPDGWNGWTVTSSDPTTFPRCPGFECAQLGPHASAEIEDGWMTLERRIDASALDSTVQLCVNAGEDGAADGSALALLADTGSGFVEVVRTDWLGGDGSCREICADLGPEAANNPSVGVRIHTEAVSGRVAVFYAEVTGADRSGAAVTLGPLTDAGAGAYTAELRDRGGPADVAVNCSWGAPPELGASTFVSFE